MRLCKKCGNKFDYQGKEPNPKCPQCGTRATKQMTKSGKQKTTEKKEGLSMWQTLQARKADAQGDYDAMQAQQDAEDEAQANAEMEDRGEN